MKRRALLLLALVPLAAVGCVVSLVDFLVPPTAFAGSIFEVVVVGNQGSGTIGEQVGAVVQLPPGFSVLGGWAFNTGFTSPPPALIQDDPAVLGLYTPQGGHSLVSFSGGSSSSLSNPIALRVRIQASSVPGPFTVKVALAAISGGAWQAQDPAGVTNFAAVTAPTHAKPITVLAVPVSGAPAWLDDATGLPLFVPATIGDPQGWGGIAFGDVDGDGRDDLACVARLGNGPHAFLHGTPSTWAESSGGLLGSSGRSEVAFGDFDGDGFLDLAHGNGQAWLGDGGLSWTASVAGMALAGDGEGVAVGDVNGDGFDDVAISGHFSPYAQCFLSNGNGTWTGSSAGLPTAAPPGAGIAGGHKLLMRDVNGDGFLDLLWARLNAPGIWLGDGAGGWTEVAPSGLEPLNAFGVDGADLDADGDVDLVFGVISIQGTSGAGVRLYRQQAGAQWVHDPSTGLPSAGAYLDVAVGDLDRDGLPDLVAGRQGLGGAPNNGLDLWRGLGGGAFALAPAALTAGLPGQWIGNPEGIAVGDVNDDSFPDVGVAAYGMGVAVFVNQMTGFAPYGDACAGALPSAPAIGSVGLPTLGNASFAWTVSTGLPGLPAVFLLGASKTLVGGAPLLPLSLGPVGAPGCYLLAAPDVLVPTSTGPSGTASVTTPVPNVPALLLETVFGQWALVAPGANPLGIVFSAGAAARIGP